MSARPRRDPAARAVGTALAVLLATIGVVMVADPQADATPTTRQETCP